jgi:hypothetical protein
MVGAAEESTCVKSIVAVKKALFKMMTIMSRAMPSIESYVVGESHPICSELLTCTLPQLDRMGPKISRFRQDNRICKGRKAINSPFASVVTDER